MAARKKMGNVVAVSNGSTLPRLGVIAMFTIPEEPKSGTTLVRAWNAHGLPLDFLPDKRTATDVFRSAARSVETRRHDGATKRVEVKVDEVLHNARESVYQITRLVRDEKNAVIEHPKAMTLAFDKSLGEIHVRELEDYDALRGLEDAIRSHYKANTKTIKAKAIRGAVRELLIAIGAQNLRRRAGGVYFVPDEYLPPGQGQSRKKQPTGPVLDGLKAALGDLYGDRADFYTLPLANDEGEREMVRKHFTLNVVSQSEELVQTVVNRVRAGKGRTVRADLVANLWNERRKIAGAIDDFTALVDVERKDLDANLRDIDKAIGELQELAET